MYSAVSVNGKRLYELARKGLEVERQARPVTVSRLELLSYDPPSREGRLRVACSKGTYVRTLCHDIGAALAAGAPCSPCGGLWRQASPWSRPSPWRRLLQHPDPASLLLGVDSYFSGRPSLVLTPQREKKVRNGMTIPFPDAPDGEYRVYSEAGNFWP